MRARILVVQILLIMHCSRIPKFDDVARATSSIRFCEDLVFDFSVGLLRLGEYAHRPFPFVCRWAVPCVWSIDSLTQCLRPYTKISVSPSRQPTSRLARRNRQTGYAMIGPDRVFSASVTLGTDIEWFSLWSAAPASARTMAASRHTGWLRDYFPRHQRMIAFWACRRFSASSQTSDCGPSMTSASTSSPRCAGRQWRNFAPPSASSIRSSVTA